MDDSSLQTEDSVVKQCIGAESSGSNVETPGSSELSEQHRDRRSQWGLRSRRGGASGSHRRRYTGDTASWGAKRRRGEGGEMPFLHGGNIKDPLNLESVKPVDVTEVMKPLEVIIPKNMHDPLNLRSITKNRNKRKRKSSKQGDGLESPLGPEDEQKRCRSNTFAACGDHRRLDDAIVSPVPVSLVRKFSAAAGDGQRQRSQGGDGFSMKYNESNDTHAAAGGLLDLVTTTSTLQTQQQVLCAANIPVALGNDESSTAQQGSTKRVKAQGQGFSKEVKEKNRFRYGNFNRYYGTRMEDSSARDPRLSVFRKEWFQKKAVLDVGCNAGYITLSIAKDFEPRRILGIDIDDHLIGVARKNIRHYCDGDTAIKGSFPASFARRYGPISAHSTKFSTAFPDNVWFRRQNYVLESDDCLNQVKEEFDVILALSITKWIHLNWGDAGLKRFFRRVFLQLRPGGLFILEPQAFRSYKKRAKITPEVQETYKSIQFLPDAFQEFLIREVGFESCELLEAPKAKTKGFEREIHLYHKRSPKFVAGTTKTPTCSMPAEEANSGQQQSDGIHGIKQSQRNP
uniref:RNA methyltransferase n=1 Tax=Ascaris lumbricoides TaxID=6252 RepID=A0A0M3IG99_ASCLU